MRAVEVPNHAKREPASLARVDRHRLNRDQKPHPPGPTLAAALTDSYVAGLLVGAIVVAADALVALVTISARLSTAEAGDAGHWEIRDDIHQAFVTLGCAIICWRRLKTAL